MRIVIVGAGAVGGSFGARLALSGHDVVFVARGAHLAALQQEGLNLVCGATHEHIPTVNAIDGSGDVAPAELVLVCVKEWQLDDSFDLIDRLSTASTMVVPLLNGVSAVDRLVARFGEDRVSGGYCMISSAIEEPGTIRINPAFPPTINIGAIGGTAAEERVQRIREALEVEGVTVVVSPNIEAGLWSKFILIGSTGSVGAISRVPIGVIRAVPETRALLISVMEELRDIGLAKGVALPADIVDRVMTMIDKVPAETMASLQREFMEGRPSELDDWVGAVVKLGDKHRHPTPLHRTMYAALLPQERRARGLET
jgi:2-dehydropantoate 2-reductase